MKKILAVILSLAMILSMTVVGFAAEVPSADAGVDAWTAYYTEIYLDETLDADAKADALLNADVILTNPGVVIAAMQAAMTAASEAGVDVDEITFAMMDKMEAEYGINIEDMLDEDVDGDGFIGDPANGVLAKPEATDVEGWTEYYTALLGQATTDPAAMAEVVSAIVDTVVNGDVDMDTFKTAFGEATKIVSGDLVNQIVWGVEKLLSMDLNSDRYIGEPDGSLDEDGKLPEDESGGGLLGDFDISGLLNTVLGFLGSIGDLLFGGGGDTPTPEDPTEDDPWADPDTNEPGSNIPDTGDTTVFAVAAVALAAGAALVMTRKKNDDAE